MGKKKGFWKKLKAGASRLNANVSAFEKGDTVKGLRSFSSNVLAGFDEDFYPKKRKR